MNADELRQMFERPAGRSERSVAVQPQTVKTQPPVKPQRAPPPPPEADLIESEPLQQEEARQGPPWPWMLLGAGIVLWILWSSKR